MVDAEAASVGYLFARQLPARWDGVLAALAEELSAQMAATEIRAFFVVLGRRWAKTLPLAASATVAELEQSINAALAECGWGFVQVRDEGTALDFSHACSPLVATFGEAATPWTVGLLEGLYEEWLRASGSSQGLSLRFVSGPVGAAQVLRFRLAAA
jgi:hypothetical protein